jgi:predicted hotdog family 3-hydroxylacyl-ACP dehydratase
MTAGMTGCAAIPIGELLPHGPEMTLLDALVEYSPQRSVANATITRRSRFLEGAAVPAWAGIEYMAQTIAAHAGYEARLRGGPPVIGFLLGTRAYRSELGEFPLGSTLTISVEPLVADPKLGAFQCAIALDRVVATAVVNTYQPAADELVMLRRGAGEA